MRTHILRFMPVLSANIVWSDISAPIELRYLWATPIQTSSILSPLGTQNSKAQINISNKFLQQLTEIILFHYETFKSNSTLVNEYRPSNESTLSDAFFLYQLEVIHELLDSHKARVCTKDLSKFKELKKYLLRLVEIIDSAIELYFKSHNIDFLPFNIDGLDLWSSIHYNRSHHLPHHHYGNCVSGVIYLQVPAHSGDLIFNDPRGPLPPFGRSYKATPRVGDMVVFPSWLVHSVDPTVGMDPRVSLSFNYKGDWSITSDVNQVVPVL